jgi:hypothetical protein
MSERRLQTTDEPMTDPQRSRLGTLAEETGLEVPAHLTKSEASKLIGELESSAP